jgi:hypothetical protein
MMSYVIPGGALICLASVVALFFGLKLVVKLGEKSRKAAPTAPANVQREAA